LNRATMLGNAIDAMSATRPMTTIISRRVNPASRPAPAARRPDVVRVLVIILFLAPRDCGDQFMSLRMLSFWYCFCCVGLVLYAFSYPNTPSGPAETITGLPPTPPSFRYSIDLP